jgi:hypothetical protein
MALSKCVRVIVQDNWTAADSVERSSIPSDPDPAVHSEMASAREQRMTLRATKVLSASTMISDQP